MTGSDKVFIPEWGPPGEQPTSNPFCEFCVCEADKLVREIERLHREIEQREAASVSANNSQLRCIDERDRLRAALKEAVQAWMRGPDGFISQERLLEIDAMVQGVAHEPEAQPHCVKCQHPDDPNDCEAIDDGYECTLRAGHKGDHKAYGAWGRYPIHTWPAFKTESST